MLNPNNSKWANFGLSQVMWDFHVSSSLLCFGWILLGLLSKFSNPKEAHLSFYKILQKDKFNIHLYNLYKTKTKEKNPNVLLFKYRIFFLEVFVFLYPLRQKFCGWMISTNYISSYIIHCGLLILYVCFPSIVLQALKTIFMSKNE